MILHPWMIQGGVIGHEIQHLPEAPRPEAIAQAGQRLVAPEVGMHGVTGDREAGAGDVLVAQVRQCLLELSAPLWIGARHALTRRSRAPDTQEPEPVEAHLADAIELGIRDVVQRGRPAQRPGQLGQPDARIDLIERRVMVSSMSGPRWHIGA
jgi:hypothetical protein